MRALLALIVAALSGVAGSAVAEYVVGGLTSWGTFHAMSTDTSFGNLLTVTVTATASGDNGHKFTLYNNWNNNYERWGYWDLSHTTNANNTTIGQCRRGDQSGDNNLTFSSFSSGKRYTFRINGNSSWWDRQFAVMETSSDPVTIPYVAHDYSATSSVEGPVTVTVQLSGNKNAEESVWIRYTTDGWTSSQIIPCSGSGTNYSGAIPAQGDGTLVSFYILTSTYASDLVANGSFTDLVTLKGNNNGGANYQYRVLAPKQQRTASWTNATSLALGDTNVTFHFDTYQQAGGTQNRSYATMFMKFGDSNLTSGTVLQGDGRDPGAAANDTWAGSPQLTSTGSWYYAMRVSYQNNTNFWVVSSNAAWSLMTAAPTSVSLSITVTNLPESTSLSAVTNSAQPSTKVDLGWTRPGSYNVMIVRRQDADPEAPANGTIYTNNQTYGTGNGNRVIYAAGSASTTNDTGLVANTSYHYGFFTENYGYYSPGVVASVTTAAEPPPPAVGLGPATVSFSATQGSFPAAQSFYVTNTGGTDLNFTNTLTYGTGASGWLSVSPATRSGLAPGASWTNTLTVTVSNLAVGTYYATNTISGNQTNGDHMVAVSVTVQAPDNPSGVTVITNTAYSATRLDLGWTKNAAGHDVMVVRSTDTAFFAPANGTTYTNGYTTNNDEVIYRGGGTSVTDSNRLPATAYYYRLYSENYTFYSGGIDTTGATATAKARNTSGGAPEQPATLYLGDTNQTFGLDSWGQIETNWGKARVVIHTNADVAGGQYGAYSIYTNVDHKQVASPQFTATGTWYWAIQMEYGSYGSNFWYATNTASWLDMTATPSPALTVTVNPLADPSSVSAITNTANPATAVNLGWTKDAQNHNVMIVRSTNDYSTAPTPGTVYNVSDPCGDGTVIYSGAGTSLIDSNLAEITTYYYVFYSENYAYYSAGARTNVTTAALPQEPVLGRGPASLTFSAYRGGTPASQNLYVTNTGGGTLVYTNTLSYGGGAGGWLAIDPSTASLTASASWTNVLSVTASNLVPDTYYATNTLSGNQTNGDQTVTVAFTVTELPVPTAVYASAVNPRSLTVNWTAAGFDVMVVRRQGALPESPAQGTAYAHDAVYGVSNQVVYAQGSGSSDTDTGVYPQTIYYYALYSENSSCYSPAATLCVTTLVAKIDGVADEWLGTAPTVVNSSTVSSNEFIWRDKSGEQRNDSGSPSDVDIEEFRVKADANDVYFYVRYRDITDVGYPYIAIGVDTDQSPTDTAVNWLADDSDTSLGDGYYTNGNAAMHYPERNIIVHNVPGIGHRIELYADNGSSWYAPPTLGNAQANFNGTDNFIEFRIARADLGLSGSVTGRFTVAGFFNNTLIGDNQWANDGDTTANYTDSDAQDSLSLLPYGVNDAAGNLGAWGEDLSDGDIDSFFDVRFDASGVALNQIPTTPAIAFPTNNQTIETGSFTLSWQAATDADGEVTSHFVEMSTNATFNGAENMGIDYRANTRHTELGYVIDPAPAATQLHWRVRSRDTGGALSGYTNTVFQTGAPDDDTQGPTPTLIFIGANYTPGLTQTNITDADLANTNNLVDIAVAWTDPSGVFTTNSGQYGNNNILASLGRVVANWDLYTTNLVTGATNSFGYDQPFTEFYGASGDTTVTTVYHNAFAITNIDTNNIFFLTVSAEDNDNDRGTYRDPQGDGDPVPWDRALTINALVQFYVTDDDSAGPVFSAFNVAGLSFTNTDLTGGLTITGLVQDAGSGVAGGSNVYSLYRGSVPVASGAFTTQPMTDGAAKSSPEPVGVSLPLDIVGHTGTYRLVTSGWDVDNDKLNDRAQGTNEFVFTVVPPPSYAYKMSIALAYDRTETLTNFPALVVFNPTLAGFSYSQFASRQGYDLRFSDASGAAWLNYEVEKWDTNGNSYVWVQVPRLSAATNSIWAYWGGASETNQLAGATNGATWAAEYRGVFHLQATNGATATDSTAAGRHGALANLASSNWVAGLIGNALSFNGGSGFVSNTLSSGWTGPFTVTFLAKASATGQAAGVGLFNNGNAGFQIETDGAAPGTYRYAGGTPAAVGAVTGGWAFLAVTCDGATTRTYYNGDYAGSVADARTTFARYDLGIDTNRGLAFNGVIDEVEIAEAARSSNWIWAMWMNVASNVTFSSFGAPQTKGAFFQIDADSSAAGVGLPYTESFETLTAGALDGQSNWNAAGGVTVQSGTVYSGNRAVRLAGGSAWHGLQPALGTNVWVDWYALPTRRSAAPADIVDLNWNATAAFYVDGSGHVVARSNVTWVTCSAVTVPSNAWTRFSVHLDYANHTWSLTAADSSPNAVGSVVASNLPFYATNVGAMVSFRMAEESVGGASYLDNLAVGAVAPLSVDEDHNGLPDTWERAYFTTNGVSPDADSDADGVDNRHERLAGTNPTDAQSYLRIAGMELASAGSSNLVVSIRGGGFDGGSPYTNTGDRIQRAFVVQRAVNDVTLPKTIVANVTDSATGTNSWTDMGAVAAEGSRYYRVAVSYAGSGYTNTDEWAAHAQTRRAGEMYLVCVPVDYGGAAANNLNSTLGRQLAIGLHADTTWDQADRLRRWDSSGNWDEYYLFTHGSGDAYWSDDLGGATTADVAVAAGAAFWVVRGSGSVSRGNTVFSGRSFAPAGAVDTTFKTNNGGWTMFGWPLAQPGRHQNLGASTPANQLGFSSVGHGGKEPQTYPGQEGDQIWVWENNTWRRWYWLVGGMGAAYDGRWWDNSTGKFADFSLEIGKAYYYWHPATGGATNFVWRPTPP